MLGDLGKRVGPPLTGMGAHGPAELLVAILDPNREVDATFVAVSIETKDGELHDGVVTRENNQLVALANAAGEKEIKKSDIKKRTSTGRSRAATSSRGTRSPGRTSEPFARRTAAATDGS